jgi:hypothetical protein
MRKVIKKFRPKKCKFCGNRFTPVRTLQQTCLTAECAYGLVRINKTKKKAKEYRAAKERQKTLTDHLKDTERVVNRYIKLRDADKPCISCGTTAYVQYAAGHFRTVKAASHLRFNEDNIHKQCNRYCNSGLSGNIAEYRPRLIARIGLARVEALENDNTTHRWTIEEAKAIKAEFSAKIKGLADGL